MSVADAEPVLRCAYRLSAVAEDVRTAAARTAGAYPSDWRGTAGIAYQQRLDETADRVRRTAAAYDAAGAALLPYARALLDAAALEQRASSLLAEALEADRRAAATAASLGVDRVVGPSPSEGLRTAAERMLAEAAEVERRAAASCAAALEDEAMRAPAASGWQKADRFVGDLMQYGAQTVAGTASLLGSAWHALPGVGSRHSRHAARHELVASAAAAAQIWNIPIDIRDAACDGRFGLAAAEVFGVAGPGKVLRGERLPTTGSVSEMEAARGAALQAGLREHRVLVQNVDSLLRGISLRDQELRGAHVMLKHVAADDRYLLARNAEGARKAATFTDRETAERLITTVLQRNELALRRVYELRPREKLRFLETFAEPTGRVAIAGSPHTVVAHKVRVVVTLEGGEPLVYTAFPEL